MKHRTLLRSAAGECATVALFLDCATSTTRPLLLHTVEKMRNVTRKTWEPFWSGRYCQGYYEAMTWMPRKELK
jgi:hypothetical protein